MNHSYMNKKNTMVILQFYTRDSYMRSEILHGINNTLKNCIITSKEIPFNNKPRTL